MLRRHSCVSVHCGQCGDTPAGPGLKTHFPTVAAALDAAAAQGWLPGPSGRLLCTACGPILTCEKEGHQFIAWHRPTTLELSAVGVGQAEVITGLRREAAGSLRRTAAIELLIAHGHWLRRDPFLACLAYYPTDTDGPAVAVPDWAAVEVLLDYTGEGLADTDSQRCVLGVAASLVGGYRVDLRHVVSCDAATVGLIAEAIRAAGGGR